MKLIQEWCLIYPKNNKRDFWLKRSVVIIWSTSSTTASKSSINSSLGRKIMSNTGKKDENRKVLWQTACWTSSDAKTQWGDSCRISFSFCFSWFSMLSLEWSFNYVAPTAFNSTIKLFRPVNRENRAFPFFPSTTGLLVTRRKKKKEREGERELKRRHKRRKRGKREREKEIVGSWMNWRTREIKTELECFSSSLSRERARQKSHADFGVNYTYRIT